MSVRITGAVLVGTAPAGFAACPPQAASAPVAAMTAATRFSLITG
jgi:hypothetical protein